MPTGVINQTLPALEQFASNQIHLTTWESDALYAAPSGWSRVWGGGTVRDRIIPSPSFSNGRAFYYERAAHGRTVSVWDAIGTHQHVDIRVRFKERIFAANGFRLFVRVDPASTAGAETGIFFECQHSAQNSLGQFYTRYFLSRYEAGNNFLVTSVRDSPFLYTPNDWMNLRMWVTDQRIRTWMWHEGEEDPSIGENPLTAIHAPFISAGLPGPTHGYVGFGTFALTTHVVVDRMHVATGPGTLAPPLPQLVRPITSDWPEQPPWVRTIENTPGVITVTWGRSRNAEFYKLYRVVNGGPVELVGQTAALTLDDVVSAGDDIEYWVVAGRLT